MTSLSSESKTLTDELGQALVKLGLTVPVWDRPVTAEEIQYFLARWPYLQILSSNSVEMLPEVQQVTAKSNWTILNYGDAMASSPGYYLFGGGDFRIDVKQDEDDEDGTGSDILNPGRGTIWRQAFDTATHMALLAKQLGWTGIHVVDGHFIMKWAIWMNALDNNLGLTGFEPTEKDLQRRERVKRSEIEDIKRFQHRFAR